MHKPESVLENVKQNSLGFVDGNSHLIPVRRPNIVIISKKKKKRRTCHLVDLSILKVKIKENEKRNKYLLLTSEQKKKKKKKSDEA